MPKVNLIPKKDKPMARLIYGYINAAGVEISQLGDEVMSESTIRRRLANESTFTLGELNHLRRKLGIPIEEMRGAIR